MENNLILKTAKILACARAAHEVNRAYCIALGDCSQLNWDNAPEWQQSSAINGVVGALKGDTPERWLQDKVSTGWKYGPIKDPDKKEHPCMVPYNKLPQEQRAKDNIFTTVVRIMAESLGLTTTEC